MGKGKNAINGVYMLSLGGGVPGTPGRINWWSSRQSTWSNPPLNRGGESSPKGLIQGHTAGEGRTKPGISSDVFSLLGRSHKGSHTTGLAALEVSGSKETLWLMHVN